MLVVMKRDATKEEIDAVVERIKEFGITPVPSAFLLFTMSRNSPIAGSSVTARNTS